MPNPERSLSTLLKDAVPTPPGEISADAIADVAERRPRRIGVIAPAAGGLLMAGVAAIAVTLPSGNGHSLAGPATDAHSTATAPNPSSGPVPHAPPGCPPSRAFGRGGGIQVDYVDFVYLHRRLYIPDRRVQPVQLGATVGRVTCTIANLPQTRYYLSPDHYRNGNASYLPVGTKIHRVPGYSSSCRVAVRSKGHIVQYLAQRNGTRHPMTRPCALHPRR